MDRKLSAILAADVVGYSALMERDETGTFETLVAERKRLIEPEVERHHGRIFKLMGDGLLAEFGSVVDAVECAVALQRGLGERNAGVPQNARLELRIGINLGEVIVDGDDRYGEGVNVAARLEQLAEPGGICVSAKVAREVEKTLAFGFESLGEQRVKNLAQPVEAYRVVLAPKGAGLARVGGRRGLAGRRTAAAAALLVLVALGLGAAWWWGGVGRSPPAALAAGDARPSLVVLPFDNLSDDKAQGYLADGFTEDLTTELARIPGLFVVSRNAAFAYKGKETPPTAIASELGVRFLLEGSFRRVGDDMRINAQLIDGSTAGHVWADRFDGRWSEIFTLQDKVVGSIADTLELRLVGDAGNPVVDGGTNNTKAYEVLLKGLEIYNRPNTPEEFAQAFRMFQDALRMDPNFGRAAAYLAWAYWDLDAPRSKALGLSEDATSTGFAAALESAARNPSTPYYQLKSDLLLREHRSDESIALLPKAIAINPSDPWNYVGLAHALNFNGQPQEAREYLDAALRVDPDPGWEGFRLYQVGLSLFTEGRFEEAIAVLEKIDLESPDPWAKFYAVQVLIAAHGQLGNAERAASYKAMFGKIFAERGSEPPNKLITQQFFVFKRNADIERMLGGLSKAGVPDLPADLGLDEADRLTGAEIQSDLFGKSLSGQMVRPKVEPFRLTIAADGVVDGKPGEDVTVWVQENFMCKASAKTLTVCGAVFRNPSGTAAAQNEYVMVNRWDRMEFSVEDQAAAP